MADEPIVVNNPVTYTLTEAAELLREWLGTVKGNVALSDQLIARTETFLTLRGLANHGVVGSSVERRVTETHTGKHRKD